MCSSVELLFYKVDNGAQQITCEGKKLLSLPYGPELIDKSNCYKQRFPMCLVRVHLHSCYILNNDIYIFKLLLLDVSVRLMTNKIDNRPN
jgi:hypothetical protein